MLALMIFFSSCATNSGPTGQVKVADGNTVHEIDSYLTSDLVNNVCVKEKLIKLFESNEARKAHGITDKDFERFLAEYNKLLIQKIDLMNAEVDTGEYRAPYQSARTKIRRWKKRKGM